MFYSLRNSCCLLHLSPPLHLILVFLFPFFFFLFLFLLLHIFLFFFYVHYNYYKIDNYCSKILDLKVVSVIQHNICIVSSMI